MKTVSISVVIPTYNNESTLPGCLAVVKNQIYPKDAVEIIIADGGSSDRTREIAKKYNCRILDNPKRLAEYGVSLGIKNAEGVICIVLATDNELADKYYFTRIVRPFIKDSSVVLAYPKQDSNKEDYWISQYINTFTDPISHFIYGNAANTRTFGKQYPECIKKKEYVVYDFTVVDYPLIALAQGTAVKKDAYVKYAKEGDDILPVITMIGQNCRLAYVEKAVVYHHTIRSVSQFMRKQRWAFDNYLFQKNYGSFSYSSYFSWKRKARKILWPFYSAFIFPPLIVGLYCYITSKKKEWLYHPALTYVVFYCLVAEFVRVIIFHEKHIQRST